MAPKSGEDMRNAIGSQAKDLTEKVKESSRHLVESGFDLLEQKKAQEFVEQAAKDAGMEVYGEKTAGTQENSDKNKDVGTTGEIKK